jgi:hypothetical protein
MAQVIVTRTYEVPTGRLGDLEGYLKEQGHSAAKIAEELAAVGLEAAQPEIEAEETTAAEEQSSSDEPKLDLPQDEPVPELQEITYVTAEELVEA